MDVVNKVDEKSKILVEGTTDENVRLIQYLPVKTEILVVSLIISCIIALSIKSIFIKYVLLHATKRRPINTLILLEQVVLLITYMIFYPLTIISIATGSYLVEIFDPKVCWFYWGAMLNHNVYSIAGGWITAVYRLCVLKCGFIKDCIGVDNLMRVLIASEFMLFSICYGFYWLHIGKGFALSVKSPAMEFCTGTSQTFRGILALYQNQTEEDFYHGRSVQNGMMYLSALFSVGEAVSYLVIFHHIFKHNKNIGIAKILAPDIIKARNHGHAITLLGQVLNFLSEIFIFGLFLTVSNPNSFGMEPATFCVFACFISAILSILQLASSPEIQRFVFQ